jgi:hypothetical protein
MKTNIIIIRVSNLYHVRSNVNNKRYHIITIITVGRYSVFSRLGRQSDENTERITHVTFHGSRLENGIVYDKNEPGH